MCEEGWGSRTKDHLGDSGARGQPLGRCKDEGCRSRTKDHLGQSWARGPPEEGPPEKLIFTEFMSRFRQPFHQICLSFLLFSCSSVICFFCISVTNSAYVCLSISLSVRLFLSPASQISHFFSFIFLSPHPLALFQFLPIYYSSPILLSPAERKRKKRVECISSEIQKPLTIFWQW